MTKSELAKLLPTQDRFIKIRDKMARAKGYGREEFLAYNAGFRECFNWLTGFMDLNAEDESSTEDWGSYR